MVKISLYKMRCCRKHDVSFIYASDDDAYDDESM